MGGAASSRRRVPQKARPLSECDTELLHHILASCEAESCVYAKRIQEAANFECDFPAPLCPLSSREEGFANSKGPSPNSVLDVRGKGDSRRATRCDRLLGWLQHHGAQLTNVGLRACGEAGFSVFCHKTIERSRPILKVPLSCLITDTMAANTRTGRKLYELRYSIAAIAHCQLSVFLLEDIERGPKSPFYSYYQSLPQSLPQHSLFWTEEDKAFLQGTCFVDDVQSFELMVRTDYNTITSKIPAFDRFGFDMFLWSRIIVSSRNFSIRINHVDHIAMVPLADMMNHHEPRRTAWEYRDEDEGFVVTALDSFATGTEITNSYGQKGASQLLLHYGFIPRNFGNNRVEMIENQITVHLSSRYRRLDSSACGTKIGTGLAKGIPRPIDGLVHAFTASGRPVRSIRSPGNMWLKKRLLGDVHVFRLRVNYAHRETASCLRYVSILAAEHKSQVQHIKRLERAQTSSPHAQIFYDLDHILESCSILTDLARHRCERLSLHARPLSSITNYNKLNAWRIAQIERAVARFFEALGEVFYLVYNIHEEMLPRLLAELQKRQDIMSQWVHHLCQQCFTLRDKLPGCPSDIGSRDGGCFVGLKT